MDIPIQHSNSNITHWKEVIMEDENQFIDEENASSSRGNLLASKNVRFSKVVKIRFIPNRD